MSRTTLTSWFVVVVVLALLLFCAGAVGLVEIPFWLAFGWIAFLSGVVPSITVSWPGMGLSVLALAGFVAGLHFGVPRVLTAFRPESPRPPWRIAWTGAIAGMVVLMFVAGIGIVGVTHQVGWLMSSDEQWFDNSFRRSVLRTQSRSKLQNIGIAMHDSHDTRGHFPPGATFDETGRALHSWQTALLPFIDQSHLDKRIDFQRPWNDPANTVAFRTTVPEYLNPGIKPVGMPSPAEYALSHYSANSHLFGRYDGTAIREITDGTSNTLLTGEITSELPAWGDPTNYRDPALGIGTSPRGFNGPWTGGEGHMAFFTLADGSVRAISDRIEPQVLKALATPDGGEQIDPDSF